MSNFILIIFFYTNYYSTPSLTLTIFALFMLLSTLTLKFLAFRVVYRNSILLNYVFDFVVIFHFQFFSYQTIGRIYFFLSIVVVVVVELFFQARFSLLGFCLNYANFDLQIEFLSRGLFVHHQTV